MKFGKKKIASRFDLCYILCVLIFYVLTLCIKFNPLDCGFFFVFIFLDLFYDIMIYLYHNQQYKEKFMENRAWSIIILCSILLCTSFIHAHLNSIRNEINHIDNGDKRLKYYLRNNEFNIKRLENNMKQVVESCGKNYIYY